MADVECRYTITMNNSWRRIDFSYSYSHMRYPILSYWRACSRMAGRVTICGSMAVLGVICGVEEHYVKRLFVYVKPLWEVSQILDSRNELSLIPTYNLGSRIARQFFS